MLTGLVIASREYAPLVYGQHELAELRRRVRLPAAPLTPEEVQADPGVLRDVEVIFGGWTMPCLDERLVAAAPKLKMIFYSGGSVKGFTTNALWHRGIKVCSAWEANGAAVADYTVGAILFGLKQGFAGQISTRKNRTFLRPTYPAGLYKSTVALISLGASGRAVARKLQGFGTRVVAFDPYVSPAQAALLGVELVGLEEAFSSSDAVSVHTPVTGETVGMLRAEHFSAMRRGAIFINTARGAIVAESQLIAVLQERPDITAILDVTDPEPPSANSALFYLPNVVLTPHLAGALGRDCGRLSGSMIEEFDRWRSGVPLQCEVDAEAIARMA